ncbi:MAG: ribokinase [Chloroflexi bacterium]|nr:ribokinase [Chloroflexota bacterium]
MSNPRPEPSGVPDPGDPSATDVLVIGSTMVDLIAYAARLPEDGETVFGERFVQGFGGKGANQAVMAARFGVAVAMVGMVGDDSNGRLIVDNLGAQGVRADDVGVAAGSSGVAPIWVDASGMNQIIIIPGANRLVRPAAAAAAVERLRPAVVVGQFEIPQAATIAAFGAARRLGAVTVLNPAPGGAIEPDLLAVTDWLVPNETEFVLIGGRALTGIAAEEAAAIALLGDALDVSLLVTLGGRGAALRPRAGDVSWIAAPEARAIDTTGAGDAFVGAFAVGLAAGLDPHAAAALGCVAASDSVVRAGTQSSYAAPEIATQMLIAARAGDTNDRFADG